MVESFAEKSSGETNIPPLLDVYCKIAYPFDLVRAEGVYVFDSSGRRYLDFYGGHCVAAVGHSPAEVAQAISQQASTLLFYSNLAPMPIRRQGAAKLLEFADNGMRSAFFCNSGGEANENALKIAIKATGRSKICAFKGGFHGRTLLALGATDNPSWHETYRGWIGEVERISPNEAEGLSRIDQNTAAVILEPIQSIGGVRVFDHDYLRVLREACHKKGAFLIFDEVQTGMGRTGVPFVSGWCGVLPDMMTLAKGLASGFPIGAVVMTEAAARTIKPGDIAATFGGGPMAMAAMIATIDAIKKQDLVHHAKHIEHYVRERFSMPGVKGVRGAGCLLGIVLDQEAKPVQTALFAQGIITGLCSDPNVVHLLPPLTIQREHIDELQRALKSIIAGRN